MTWKLIDDFDGKFDGTKYLFVYRDWGSYEGQKTVIIEAPYDFDGEVRITRDCIKPKYWMEIAEIPEDNK